MIHVSFLGFQRLHSLELPLQEELEKANKEVGVRVLSTEQLFRTW